MQTKTIYVKFFVDVTLDEAKFDADFLEGYAESFGDSVRTLDDHFNRLAELECRGELTGYVEGYGPLSDMGISAEVTDVEAEGW